MRWLQKHLEEFVRPVLGYVPTVKKEDQRFFTPAEMTLLKSVWRSVKAEARRLDFPILFAGRDVFLFYVLAMREYSGIEVVFRPEISRPVSAEITDNFQNYVCLDTGYAGSVPKRLKCKSWFMLSCNVHSIDYHYRGMNEFDKARWPYKPIGPELHQMFPRSKDVRSLATKLERSPKYWKRGQHYTVAYTKQLSVPQLETIIKDGWSPTTGIVQGLHEKKQFETAAKLTIQVYTDSSPRYVDKLNMVRCEWPTWAQGATD